MANFRRGTLAICLIVAMVCCGRGPARADDAASVSTADHKAIEQVITSQLDAFRRDAGAAAFSFASPHIQSVFGDAAHFMAMVRQGYPPVYRPRSFKFEKLITIKERIVQRVMIIGPDGSAALALYKMEREQDGTWRIDGCALTQTDGLNT
ncbi:DUF4864 domain-containing protein [Rhodopila sp.]|uniref:DUF4864 domain-containing protein n=1 Tax=Rhodopila sp. TaxID=2480087 RepID=UPI003D0E7674